MSIWNKNLWEFKGVRIAVISLIVLAVLFYFISYNSIENKCKRKYGLITSFFTSKAPNELGAQMYKTATDSLVESCIKFKEVN